MKMELPETVRSETLEQLANELGLKTKAAKTFMRIVLINTILMDKKQQDYGPKNISGFGTLGVLVRMNDKMERLKTLMGRRRKKPANESIIDSLQDISNYGAIAIMVEKGIWPDIE